MIYDIVDSNDGLKLQFNKLHHLRDYNNKLNNFKMKDHIFFPAHVAFLHMLEFSCFIGYRKDIQNNICVDVDECKIMRHYCDSRRRFQIYSLTIRNLVFEFFKTVVKL